MFGRDICVCVSRDTLDIGSWCDATSLWKCSLWVDRELRRYLVFLFQNLCVGESCVSVCVGEGCISVCVWGEGGGGVSVISKVCYILYLLF